MLILFYSVEQKLAIHIARAQLPGGWLLLALGQEEYIRELHSCQHFPLQCVLKYSNQLRCLPECVEYFWVLMALFPIKKMRMIRKVMHRSHRNCIHPVLVIVNVVSESMLILAVGGAVCGYISLVYLFAKSELFCTCYAGKVF